jgi:bifunctional UDP-N-acetylglucosamine pyrophosphorylase/glucosamine-1-phosphate N-acetyltransferase
MRGVTMLDPFSVFIDVSVTIGRDTVLYPNVRLEGKTTLGEGCTVYPGSRIVDSTCGNEVTIKDCCVIEDSRIADKASVGPFAHLRPGTVLGPGSRIGNFVEVKKSVIGEGSKANHLAYIGDATVGKDVNIGAGVITCNYDGFQKHQTIIDDGVFVGSDAQLVAPVRIGKDALVAAGTRSPATYAQALACRAPGYQKRLGTAEADEAEEGCNRTACKSQMTSIKSQINSKLQFSISRCFDN